MLEFIRSASAKMAFTFAVRAAASEIATVSMTTLGLHILVQVKLTQLHIRLGVIRQRQDFEPPCGRTVGAGQQNHQPFGDVIGIGTIDAGRRAKRGKPSVVTGILVLQLPRPNVVIGGSPEHKGGHGTQKHFAILKVNGQSRRMIRAEDQNFGAFPIVVAASPAIILGTKINGHLSSHVWTSDIGTNHFGACIHRHTRGHTSLQKQIFDFHGGRAGNGNDRVTAPWLNIQQLPHNKRSSRSHRDGHGGVHGRLYIRVDNGCHYRGGATLEYGKALA